MTQDGNASPTQYSLESYLDQLPRSPPGNYPIPDTGLQNVSDATFISYGIHSVEEKKEFLEITRNSLDIFSSILNSEVESKPLKVTIFSFVFTKLMNYCSVPSYIFLIASFAAAVITVIFTVLVSIDDLIGLI